MLDFKVAQKYSPKIPKSVCISFYSQSDVFKIAKHFYNKNYHQELLKIAQSGHTDDIGFLWNI